MMTEIYKQYPTLQYALAYEKAKENDPELTPEDFKIQVNENPYLVENLIWGVSGL